MVTFYCETENTRIAEYRGIFYPMYRDGTRWFTYRYENEDITSHSLYYAMLFIGFI